ncbi:MAG: PDZ domain-containing protein [Hydrogenibacillus schlegelii]|uniref:endopeptidase La n=1 Tax=Hydrogenibacillus schlegelii TaxID=1484 RepID=A0A947CZV0_HYDSH|nr:PDZ domain-containing protein [Hydrogenibacillus schlegelii]
MMLSLGRARRPDVRPVLRLILALAVGGAAALWPLPYFILLPGSAIPLDEAVHVEDAYHDEVGTFYLTTVRADRATLIRLAAAAFRPAREIVRMDDLLFPHEDVDHYFSRQQAVMEAAEKEALIVAFRKAGVPIAVENRGALVTGVVPGSPADGVLNAGDVITAVDGVPTPTAEDLLRRLASRDAGTPVRLRILREGRPLERTVRLAPFPGSRGRPGLGLIQPLTAREVRPSLAVTIDLEPIGGPSAGLMLTLALINRLVPGDLTHGHRIAGTGTIDLDGRVGRVGGVSLKVLAAAAAGADVFFVPDDPPEAGRTSNVEEARRTNERFRLGLTIVPVRTVDDALQYLRTAFAPAQAGPAR